MTACGGLFILPCMKTIETSVDFGHDRTAPADIRDALERAATVAVRDVLGMREGERALIVSNPREDVATISMALYRAIRALGATPVLIFQEPKTQTDFADEAVIEAFKAEYEVAISMSAQKLGKDREAISKPYRQGEKSWDHIYHYLMYGKKNLRSFWSPGTTVDSFIRTVPIDYDLLARRAAAIKAILDRAVAVTVTAPGGTDIHIGLENRLAMLDDGNFRSGGDGGNLPAGEAFISPVNGTASGTIVFDGSMSLNDRDILVTEPIVCTVDGGFVRAIEGGDEAAGLRESVEQGAALAREFEKNGKLAAGEGARYAQNARNIGELGIGLNPAAIISGAMLEDEKAFRTCHFAIGANYDEDAPALIHLDGLVKNPTITAVMASGDNVLIEETGELVL